MRCLVLALLAAGCGNDGLHQPVDATPIDAPFGLAENGVRLCGKAVVYLVVDGGVVVGPSPTGFDDARVNESIHGPLFVDPITDRVWADAFATDLAIRLAALNIPMSTIRPQSGDYTMVGVDGSPIEFGGARWKLTADCNSDNPNEVIGLNGSVFTAMQPEHAASWALYALGISVGLDNVMAQQNCMALILHETCTFADGVTTSSGFCETTQQDQLVRLSEVFRCP